MPVSRRQPVILPVWKAHLGPRLVPDGGSSMKLVTILAVIVALLGVTGCETEKSGRSPPPIIPTDVSYTVIGTETVPHIKRSLDVRLNKKVSEDVLRAIALELKSIDSNRYARTLHRLLPTRHDRRCWRLGHPLILIRSLKSVFKLFLHNGSKLP